jgi:signal transduction histidine kinase
MPGTRLLLRISVLLPIASVFVLGLTAAWQRARIPDGQIVVLTLVALLPALLVYLPFFERWLKASFLVIALGVYLICQTLLSSLLHNLGLVRFDMVQLGPLTFLEPGVLLIIPPLLVAWQYGWIGALLASATVGTLHMVTGVLIHRLMPNMPFLSPVTPILRPDLLYFLPLIVAYLGILLRRQLHEQEQSTVHWREFAATAEVLAVERERKRLGSQLQETLGRSLAVLNEQLDAITAALGALPETAAEKVRRAQTQVRTDLKTTEQAIVDLQANPLLEYGLIAAIRVRADALAQEPGIVVDIRTSELPDGMTQGQELVLYHIADQALRHVVRHPGVQRIDLQLTKIERFVALTIHDDGACQCHASDRRPADIEDMAARTQLIGGHFCFDSQGEGGNTFAVWLPCGRE